MPGKKDDEYSVPLRVRLRTMQVRTSSIARVHSERGLCSSSPPRTYVSTFFFSITLCTMLMNMYSMLIAVHIIIVIWSTLIARAGDDARGRLGAPCLARAVCEYRVPPFALASWLA
jgi:hypothetical protein